MTDLLWSVGQGEPQHAPPSLIPRSRLPAVATQYRAVSPPLTLLSMALTPARRTRCSAAAALAAGLALVGPVDCAAQGMVPGEPPGGWAPGPAPPNYFLGDTTMTLEYLDTSAYPYALCNGAGSRPAFRRDRRSPVWGVRPLDREAAAARRSLGLAPQARALWLRLVPRPRSLRLRLARPGSAPRAAATARRPASLPAPADGSPGAYYFLAGAPESDLWMVYLQGGASPPPPRAFLARLLPVGLGGCGPQAFGLF